MTFEIKKPVMYIYRGLPGIGKSRDARQFQNQSIQSGRLAVIIERDIIRRELNPERTDWYTKEFELEVTNLHRSRIQAALHIGADVLVADTNLPNSNVKQLMRLGVNAGADIEIIDMRDPKHYPLEMALSQNALRHWSKVVPEEFIIDRYERFIKNHPLTNPDLPAPAAGGEEFEIEPYVQGNGKRAYIFDIDGTLAIMGDRGPYDGHLVHLDTVEENVATVLDLLEQNYYIYIVTGRDEKYRYITEKWLSDAGIVYDKLLMRPTQPDGEKKTEDSIVKYRLFQEHIAPERPRIMGVFDDRHRVLRMWRKLGLTTFHINGPDAGNF
ncbi:polynucleotide kinase [Arthrobacter phage Thunderclap]|uniref:Polynucleotide kinase n=6 Tax=Amigovirus amigo TaxID=1982100 RepID=A0A5J6TBU1_9CAUD|nr:DNA repair kinase [Arthrobacter phage Amigo]QFG08356.1 polynucleotide kinase [Arthrobacter phage Yeezus]QFG13405.1 polynucleotide kinase [Arthrobacter phage Ichor]QFG13923.1 polynucleotide kinase [Arthrobacter phage Jaek]QJD51710.1 polynucleotide kinase [Arthrobacter phage Boersma]QOR56117.1 polynucleotide kinase [Arthrobacter phage Thunderclap]